jgi:predicted nucleic acid-binding protein
MRHGVLADTGPLYAAVDRNDQFHRRAQTELNRLSQSQLGILIAFPTLFEAHALILRRLGEQTSFNWLKEIGAGATLVAPNLEDYRAAQAKLFKYPDQAITLYDALVSVLAARAKVPVWTYDHHFDAMRTRVWR